MADRRMIRSMSPSPTSTARNCTIGWRPRSIRWHSSFSLMRSSARRRPRGKAGRWRLLGMIGAVSLLRLIGFVSVDCRRARAERAGGAIRRPVRRRWVRDCGKSPAARPWSLPRPCPNSRQRSPNASRGPRVRKRTDDHRHAVALFRIAVSQFRRRLVRRRGRSCGDDRLCRADAARRRLAQCDGMDPRQDFHVPRPAAHRTHHAVFGAGRRDVVLPRPVAPPRAGRRARRRRLRLAIRGAGDDRGVRCSEPSRRPSTIPYRRVLHERSKRLESEMLGENTSALQESTSGFWVRQKSAEGAAIINAKSSREQGSELGGVSVYTFDADGHFQERIEAKSARLQDGYWQLDDARIYSSGSPPRLEDSYQLTTNLTLEQVRESFATPETVPFWQLPSYIDMADRAGLMAAGYRLQYQQLLARPFLLAAMVMLAASVSLRFFRFGGVQKMVLSGISAGFLLFVLSKITEDMSKSELMSPVAAAWIPVLVGGLTGFRGFVVPGGRLAARWPAGSLCSANPPAGAAFAHLARGAPATSVCGSKFCRELVRFIRASINERANARRRLRATRKGNNAQFGRGTRGHVADPCPGQWTSSCRGFARRRGDACCAFGCAFAAGRCIGQR